MVTRCSRTRTLAALVLLSALLLTACSGAASMLTAAEAGPKYQQLSTDLADALAAKFPGEPWLPVGNQGTRLNRHNDGSCILYIGTLRSQDSLPDLDGGWETVMVAVNPVLLDDGFDGIKETDSLKGGWTGISSSDDNGGEFRISAKGYTDLSVTAEVSDPVCSVTTQ